MKDVLRALRDILIFWAFVGVLVTAPTWAKWIDGETDQWERAQADGHWKTFQRINGDDGDSRRYVVSDAVRTTEKDR